MKRTTPKRKNGSSRSKGEGEPFHFESYVEQFPQFVFPSSEPLWSKAHSFSIQGCVNNLGRQGGNGTILQVTNGNGMLSPFAGINVLAVMIHPRDADARNELLATVKTADISETLTSRLQGTMPKRSLQQLLALLVAEQIEDEGGIEILSRTRGLDAVRNEMLHRVNRGQIVGAVLLKIARLALGRPPFASVKKAAFLVEQELDAWQEHHEVDIPTSSRRIQEIWEEYKPAAHLWAAIWLWEWGVEASPFHRHETLLTFLAQAEIFRQFGLLSYPRGRTRPFLDLHEVWKLPPDLLLPETQITIAPLTEREVSILQNYRAPSSD